MLQRESVQATFTRLIIAICLAVILFFPLSAEDAAKSHTESPDGQPGKPETDSLPSELILARPSLLISLQHIITKTPHKFEIQPFMLASARNDPKSDIQDPPRFKLQQFERTAYTTSLVTLTSLSLVDVVTTIQALKYDRLTEGNPVMKPLVNNIYLFTAVKLGVTALNCYLLKKLHKKSKPLAWVLSLTANLVMSWVVANNIRMIQNARTR